MSALSRNCAHHVEKQSHALIEVKNMSTPLLNCMQISRDRHAKNQTTKVRIAKNQDIHLMLSCMWSQSYHQLNTHEKRSRSLSHQGKKRLIGYLQRIIAIQPQWHKNKNS